MISPALLLLFVINWLAGPEPPGSSEIGKGIHPSIATDPVGRVHVVYGQGDLVFYTTSPDGKRFDKPVRVDSLPGLHIGASRGPQISATGQSVVIAALDKAGNVWAYTLMRTTSRWQKRVRVTDVADIAKEGFVALTAGGDSVYNAVWLDLRGNKRNKLVGARSTDAGRTWSANEVLYQSPDGTVCECCQLSAVSQGRQVVIMFRNFLNGSRDMHLLKSADGGLTFGEAQKIGEGTWKLNACPMDGGGVWMTPDGLISTVWRRNDKLFFARSGQPETEIATGKNAKIATTAKGDYIVFQQDGQVWMRTPDHTRPTSIGSGAYPKLTRLSSDHIVCVWEQEGTIRAEVIP
ncbi:exo-alpha-sialidase [Spirosoma areae]